MLANNISTLLVSFVLKIYTKIWIGTMLKIAAVVVGVDYFGISQPTFLYWYMLRKYYFIVQQ